MGLTPTPKRGEMHATLHGEFGVIQDWLDDKPRTLNDNTPSAFATGVSLSLGAGARIGHHNFNWTMDVPA